MGQVEKKQQNLDSCIAQDWFREEHHGKKLITIGVDDDGWPHTDFFERLTIDELRKCAELLDSAISSEADVRTVDDGE